MNRLEHRSGSVLSPLGRGGAVRRGGLLPSARGREHAGTDCLTEFLTGVLEPRLIHPLGRGMSDRDVRGEGPPSPR